MGGFSTITQRSFLRGLNAAIARFDQPRGSLPAISNLLYDKRGNLRTCDGSQILWSVNGAGPGAGLGAFLRIFLHQPAGSNRFYLSLMKDPTTPALATPASIVLTDQNVGGGLLVPATTYGYRVTAIDGIGGETLASATVTRVLGGGQNAIKVEWDVVAGAAGYKVYGRTSGSELFIAQVAQPVFDQPIPGGTKASYIDDGTITPAGALPGANTTSEVLRLLKMPNTSNYTIAAATIAIFPADPMPNLDGTPGGSGGSTGGGGPTYQPGSGAGASGGAVASAAGVVGNTGPLPHMIDFTDKVIMALGNTHPLMIYDGTTTKYVRNTFTAQYPTWQASVSWLVGDYVVPTVSNSHYYKCVQAGVNGAIQPTWPTTTGARVTDGQVIWQEAGLVTTSPAPPGAAHVINHAGALWVFNTAKANTADGLDGPSALRMSDVNNPNSWNPLNAAFIGKDDGSQGMGLAVFTIAEVGVAPIGSLVAFKEFTSYQITGVFGSPNFNIQQIQTDMGCVAPRSVQFVPGFGIVRLSHLGITLFDGVRDRIISEELRPYLFDEGLTPPPPFRGIDWNYAYLSKSALTADPPMYVLACPVINAGNPGELTRLFCYDLVLKAWTIVDLPFSIQELTYVKSPGSLPITLFGGSTDGVIERWQANDINGWRSYWTFTAPDIYTFQAGTAINWSYTTPEVFNSQDPTAGVYVRSLRIRGQLKGQVILEDTQTPGLATFPLTISLKLQDHAGVTYIRKQVIDLAKVPPPGLDTSTGYFECLVDIDEVVLNANATISGRGRVEIEVAAVWDVKPQSTRVPAVVT